MKLGFSCFLGSSEGTSQRITFKNTEEKSKKREDGSSSLLCPGPENSHVISFYSRWGEKGTRGVA